MMRFPILYEYLIIGSNKGLIIFKFDSDNKAPLITLSNMPWLDKTKIQNFPIQIKNYKC